MPIRPNSPAVVGIDPGCRETGLVARQGRHLVGAWLIARDDGSALPTASYCAEVLDGVQVAIARVSRYGSDVWAPFLAVEGLVVPRGRNPQGEAMVMDVTGLLGTAVVLGAILAVHPDIRVIQPGSHGSLPRGAYPAALFGPREQKGHGKLRHCRSAWDIAEAAIRRGRMGP